MAIWNKGSHADRISVCTEIEWVRKREVEHKSWILSPKSPPTASSTHFAIACNTKWKLCAIFRALFFSVRPILSIGVTLFPRPSNLLIYIYSVWCQSLVVRSLCSCHVTHFMNIFLLDRFHLPFYLIRFAVIAGFYFLLMSIDVFIVFVIIFSLVRFIYHFGRIPGNTHTTQKATQKMCVYQQYKRYVIYICTLYTVHIALISIYIMVLNLKALDNMPLHIIEWYTRTQPIHISV